MKRFLVPLYLRYIKFFAKLRLGRIKPLIIGIGGSSGKSSLSHLVFFVLSEKLSVHSSKGKNSETGIPLDILGIEIKDYTLYSWIKSAVETPFKLLFNKDKFDIYIAEMGIDSPYAPKNMSYLLSILKPNIAALTNIDIEHSMNFDDLVEGKHSKTRKEEIIKAIANEEGKLLKLLESNQKAVVNLDDPNIKNLLPLRANTLRVSEKNKNADFYIKNIIQTKTDFEVKFRFLKDEFVVRINQPLPAYYAITIVMAIAVCFASGVSIRKIIDLIEKKFLLPPGRFSVFKGIKNTTIFDSSYNNSLKSAVGAIELVGKIGEGSRKVAILGDMRELGTLSKIQHEALAGVISKNIDFAILIGKDIQNYTSPKLKEESFNHLSFMTYSDAKDEILKKIKAGDLILVKGSQNELYLERVVELLLLNKKDKDLLPRRGSFWDKKRRNTP